MKTLSAFKALALLPCLLLAFPIYAQLSVTVTTVDVSCNGGNNGSATAFPTGGTVPYTYLWNDGASQTTVTATGLIAGTYNVLVSDSAGDTSSANLTINEPAVLNMAITSVVDVSCNGSNDGSACMTVSGGVSLYTYVWNTTPFQSTACATGLNAGVYTGTVTDANGCDSNSSVIIVEPAALILAITSVVDVSCNGSNDGSACMTVSGGVPPFTYLWNTLPVQITACATGLSAGMYSGTVTDMNGCTTNSSVIINEPALLTVSVSSLDVTCNGACDGSATAIASGGVGAYTYFWNTTPMQNTATAMWLCPGNYTVTIADANGCTANSSATITEPTLMGTAIASITVATCGMCDGTASSITSGGTPPYTYLWDDPMAQTTANGAFFCAGVYTIMATDANGCTSNTSVTILESGGYAYNIGTTDPTCGVCDGVATSAVTGGITPYTYSWSNGATTSQIDSVCPGSYTLQVTDSSGCIGDTTITLTNNGGLTAIITDSTNVSCNGTCDGTATVTASGGAAPFTFLWSDGQTDSAAVNLCAGTYNVTVLDSVGCQSFTGVTITGPPAMSVTLATSDATCFGNCDGNITASVTGGTPPYTYLWDDPFATTTQNTSALCAGTYMLYVTDSFGCVDSVAGLINQPTQLTGNISVTPATIGNCDGTATISITGGNTPYTYLWNDPGMQFIAIATGLCAGTYCVTVTDVNGCTFMDCDTVTADSTCFSLSVSITSTDISCNGLSDGSATAAVSGGTIPYTYSWTPSGGTSATEIGLSTGSYSVLVTDSNGCNTNAATSILEPSALIASGNSANATCGLCDGNAGVVVFGGTVPYSYIWTSGDTISSVPGLCAGVYGVTVADANGCSSIQSATVGSDNLLIGVVDSVVDAACGICDGLASVSVSNGTAPYTYIWSSGDSTQIAGSLCAGIYTVQVLDSAACTYDTSITVNNVGGLLTAISGTVSTLCNADSNGAVTVIATGGQSPYTYLWNDPSAQSNASATNLAAGNYTVTVTDSSGCISMSMGNVLEPSVISINLTITNETCAGSADAMVLVNASGGVGNYTYSLADSNWVVSNLFDSALTAGSILILVSDSNGCIADTTGTIASTGSPIVITPNVTNAAYCGIYGTISYPITGGTGPYSIVWTPQPYYVYWWKTNALAYPGSYSILVTDANGCTGSTNVVVPEFCPPNLIKGNVFNDANANCTPDGSDSPLSGWMVEATPGPYSTYTNYNGDYELRLDSGTYTLSLINTDMLRQTVCPSGSQTYTLTLDTTPNTTANLDFSVQAAAYCPSMWVGLSHVGFRPCFSSWYKVLYENNGTAAAANSYIEVTFPPEVTPTLVSNKTYWNRSPYNSTPWDSQSGNTYTYDLGTVDPEETGSFYILIEISCSAVMNSTLCVEAHIYPDTSCFPVDTIWDKSSVSVLGSCVGDSACFVITNTGDPGDGDMQATSPYRIYENNILVYTGTFQIAGGGTLNVCWAANSNTIRLEADQRPGHPGNSHPQDNVELCGSPSFTLGQITLTQEDDLDDFIEVKCTKVTGSWDPNDKTVYPEGLTDNYHFIDSTDQLEYRIRFQNTGTDTAFYITVRDTISEFLDIRTVVSGSSSFPYTLELIGSNILQWKFDSILLPDSNVNEAASHGFVFFKIDQMEGNIKGTVIENRVGIIFDYNDPVITNIAFNTVGDIDSLTISKPEIYMPDVNVRVYPNPFTTSTTFEIDRNDSDRLTFELFNVVGQRIKFSSIVGDKFTFKRGGLSDGIYIYKISASEKLIGTGKLVVN